MLDEKHIPVLLNDVMELFPSDAKHGWDVTFGRGGHAAALLERFPELKICGFDRDVAAIDYGTQKYSQWIQDNRLKLLHENFHNIDQLKSFCPHPDFILADLGVSSPQLDQPERGFSFYQDGPLDMRMDQSQSLMASTVVNEWEGSDLVELFKELGEVRSPGRVVDAIVEDRKQRPFTRTQQLSEMIARVDGWRKKGHHPATKYFLALRMQVNAEISALEPSILEFIKALSPGGRLIVITFHSLEDRIVKWALKNSEGGKLVNKKVIQAAWSEKQKNPRARSAKLRVFEKS